jgi:hypothetical protein
MHEAHTTRSAAVTLNLERPVIALEPGQVFSLVDATGTHIQARTGVLWITYEDSHADVILNSGEAVVVSRGGRTVVQALQAACLALQ